MVPVRRERFDNERLELLFSCKNRKRTGIMHHGMIGGDKKASMHLCLVAEMLTDVVGGTDLTNYYHVLLRSITTTTTTTTTNY